MIDRYMVKFLYIFLFYNFTKCLAAFGEKKVPRVFTNHWESRKQPEFKSHMYKVSKIKVFKNPTGAIRVLVSGP